MTAKQYLSQAKYLDIRIDSKLREISELRDIATKCTSGPYSDMPRNPNRGSSRMENAIIKIIDLENEINDDIDRLVAIKHQIQAVISELENPEEITVLEKRYLAKQRFEQIAVDMNFSIENIFKIHKRALEHIKVPSALQ